MRTGVKSQMRTGGEGVKKSQNLRTSYMDGPKEQNSTYPIVQICHFRFRQNIRLDILQNISAEICFGRTLFKYHEYFPGWSIYSKNFFFRDLEQEHAELFYEFLDENNYQTLQSKQRDIITSGLKKGMCQYKAININKPNLVSDVCRNIPSR